jgi:hypothetical protein
MSGEKIDDIGITSLEELTLYIPNVTINGGAGTPNLFIRGVGSGTNAGFEQSVGMYIDEFEGKVEALYEHDHGEQQYNLVLSGPLTDNLSGRMAVRYDAMDGWWDNVTNGDEGPDLDNWYARGSIRWLATDNLEINAKYEYGDFDRGARPTVVYQSDFAGQENFLGTVPFPVISDRDKGAGDVSAGNTNETDVFAVTVNWDLNFATMTSISARYHFLCCLAVLPLHPMPPSLCRTIHRTHHG